MEENKSEKYKRMIDQLFETILYRVNNVGCNMLLMDSKSFIEKIYRAIKFKDKLSQSEIEKIKDMYPILIEELNSRAGSTGDIKTDAIILNTIDYIKELYDEFIGEKNDENMF